MNEIEQLLPIIIPCVVIVYALVAFALLDLRKQSETRGPKWMWAVFIFLGGLIGPLAYFLVARKED